ncbi:ABC-F family ATP-binding cassette domain-containing protein [soil metagenome]
MFALSHVSVAFGRQHVLDDLNLSVPVGDRVALVGENGSGKSTLLQVLAGSVLPDSGHVVRPSGAVGWQEQTPPWPPGMTVGQVLDGATEWAQRLTGEVDQAGRQFAADPGNPQSEARLARAIDTAEAARAWQAEDHRDALVREFLADDVHLNRQISQLSGGQRARLHLVCLFAGHPVALLLDEPTNHLDDTTVDILTERLVRFDGPVVFASHDRKLINDVATGVLDLDPLQGSPTVVPGGWTEYRHAHELKVQQWQQAFADQRDQVNAAKAAIRATRQPTRVSRPTDGDKHIKHAKQQRSQSTSAARLRRIRNDLAGHEQNRVDKPPPTLHLRAQTWAATSPTGVLLSAQDVSVRNRLAPTRLNIPSGARILITGPNGVGKSTLLGVLDGTIEPTGGTVLRQPGVRIGRLGQDPLSGATDETPRSYYRRVVAATDDVPALVELGLVLPRDLDRQVTELSVGQRRRLALATVIANAPHLLLLDEPTDHLSLTLVEELEGALDTSPGAVVIASHDRWLRHRWSGDIISLGSTGQKNP